MASTAETVGTLRAMIERIDLKLLELIEEDPGLDHERMQRIAALETSRSAAWRLLHRLDTAATP